MALIGETGQLQLRICIHFEMYWGEGGRESQTKVMNENPIGYKSQLTQQPQVEWKDLVHQIIFFLHKLT